MKKASNIAIKNAYESKVRTSFFFFAPINCATIGVMPINIPIKAVYTGNHKEEPMETPVKWSILYLLVINI